MPDNQIGNIIWPSPQPQPPTSNASNAASTPSPQSPAQIAGPRGRGEKKSSKDGTLYRLNAGERAKAAQLYQEGVTTRNLAIRFGVPQKWFTRTLFPAYGIKPAMGRPKWDTTK